MNCSFYSTRYESIKVLFLNIKNESCEVINFQLCTELKHNLLYCSLYLNCCKGKHRCIDLLILNSVTLGKKIYTYIYICMYGRLLIICILRDLKITYC